MHQQDLQRPILISGHLIAVDPLTVSPKSDSDKHFLPSQGAGGRPYIPSSTLRHAIRVGAFRAVRDVLAEAGKPLPPDMSLLLYNGAGERKLKADLSWEDEQALRAINPFISLFGLWKLQTRLSVGNAYGYKCALTEAENLVARRALSARKVPESQDIAAQPSFVEYLSHLEALAEQERAGKKAKAAEDNDKAKGSDLSVASIAGGWEEFIAGAKLDWRLSLFSPNDPFLLPLLAAAFERLSYEPWLGGHRSSGCGQYAVELAHGESKILIRDNMTFEPTGIFRSALDQFWEQAQTGFADYDFASLGGH
ncbi:hypothetical protein [Acidithiobacillus ferrooxidans]|uniref:hypothetical protein n=1 Tax=Acidithiobacillus ferrooxidans TaxID=920 RepID=UPI000AE9BE1E|nr:hypothetical protein [Acidithiobacillus ferrooxidans]